MDGISLLTITVLAVFVGFEVVSKVSSTLHTPLMSGANAIHGIILVGAIIVAGQAADPWVLAVALLAVVLATANLVGGFVVTDRMLEMFRGRGAWRTDRRRRRPAAKRRPASRAKARHTMTSRLRARGAPVTLLDPTLTALLYLAAAVFFILALKGLSSPRTARRGNLIGAFGALARRGHRVLLDAARQRPVDPRRHRGRVRRGRTRGPAREDDPDAAARRPVQRRGRRGGRARGAAGACRMPTTPGCGSPSSSRCWWARCRSPAPPSPSPSCRS